MNDGIRRRPVELLRPMAMPTPADRVRGLPVSRGDLAWLGAGVAAACGAWATLFVWVC